MSKALILILTLCCFIVNAQQIAVSKTVEFSKTTEHKMERDILLKKMRKATDPKDLAKNWKTMIAKIQMSVPMQQISISVTAMYKFPDKSKVSASTPGVPGLTEVFNGKQAWKETAGLGIQIKTGQQLAFAEFECKKSNPALKLDEIYKKIELDPYLYKAGDFSCYKLTCHLPEELKMNPTRLFIDNKDFLPRYSIESQLSEMGPMEVTVTLADYAEIEGVKNPMLIVMNMMGIEISAKVISMKINEDIPDTEFMFPETAK